MKHITDIIPEIEKIVPAREAKNIHPSIEVVAVWKNDDKVKGKRLIRFKPYVHPFKSVEENFRNLKAEEKAIQSVFPSYRAPSITQIRTLANARKAMTKEIRRDGTIAEKSLPKASEVWLSRMG